MPKSRTRKPNKSNKKKEEVFTPQKLSTFGRFMLLGEVQALIHSFSFILLGMYLMEQTDKISLRTKLTIDAIELSIVNLMGVNSYLILRAGKRKKHVRWLEARQALNFIGGITLLWITNSSAYDW